MPPTVLLIDDDLHILQMLKANFEEEGFNVLTGQDGQVAIQYGRYYQPDLIIMDVNMPVYNGLKALEALREGGNTRNIPVVLLTGAQSDTIYPYIQKYQRVTFIKKPVDLEQINSLVRQLLVQSLP